jgi:L-amino acid N-acyltransferase YncA
MMVPGAFAGGKTPDLLLAVQNSPLRFAGAAAFQQIAVAGGIGWNVTLHIIPEYRRRGIGSRLMGNLAERARACRLMALETRHEVDRESGAGPFLRSLGFQLSGREFRSEVELKRYLDVFMGIRDRLRERTKIPATVRVIPMSHAPRGDVLRFFAVHRNASAHDAEAIWPPEWDAKSTRETSVVLMDSNQVIGLAIGGESDGDRMVGGYRVISPDQRRSWANVLLSAEAADRQYQRGIRRVEYISTSQTPDTLAITSLYGSEPIKTIDRYVLRIAREQPGEIER